MLAMHQSLVLHVDSKATVAYAFEISRERHAMTVQWQACKN